MMTSNTEHPGRDATVDTTPFPIWKSAVIEIAKVSAGDADRYVTSGRFLLWFDSGEPAWMAASSVNLLVIVGKREDRADGEVNAMRATIRKARGQS